MMRGRPFGRRDRSATDAPGAVGARDAAPGQGRGVMRFGPRAGFGVVAAALLLVGLCAGDPRAQGLKPYAPPGWAMAPWNHVRVTGTLIDAATSAPLAGCDLVYDGGGSTRTDPQGRFRFEGQFGATITIAPQYFIPSNAYADGRVPSPWLVGPLALPANSGFVDLGVHPVSGSQRLVVEVVDAAGRPLPFFPVGCVFLKRPGNANRQYYAGVPWSYRADESGRASISFALPEVTTPLLVYVPCPEPSNVGQSNLGLNPFAPSAVPIQVGSRKAPPWDQLTPSERTKLPPELQEARDREDVREALANPNAALVVLRPGTSQSVRIVYQPGPDDINVRFRLRDSLTSESLTRAAGFLILPDEWRQYEDFVADAWGRGTPIPEGERCEFDGIGVRPFRLEATPDGVFAIPSVTLTRPLLRKRQKALDAWVERGGAGNMDDGLSLYAHLVVTVPGYAHQRFGIELHTREGDPVPVYALSPEATLTGRLIDGKTGAPFPQTPTAFPAFATVTLMDHEGVVVRGSSETWARRKSCGAAADAERRFVLNGMSAGDGWLLDIAPHGYLSVSRRNLVLRPGLNDLGDIPIHSPSTLTVCASDASGSPLPGTEILFPGNDAPPDGFAQNPTDAKGEKVFPTALLPGDRFAIRLFPPWGVHVSYGPPSEWFSNHEYRERFLWYERVLTVDRTQPGSMSARLEKGKRLTVEIPPCEALRRIRDMDFTQDPDPRIYPYLRAVPHAAVARVVVMGLDETESGLVYHQAREAPPLGWKFKRGGFRLDLDNVPPGRYALRIDLGVYVPESRQHGDFRLHSFPFIYREFRMGTSKEKIEVTPNLAMVKVVLDRPAGDTGGGPPVWVVLERTTPLSSSLGGEIQSNYGNTTFQWSTRAEDPRGPFVGGARFIPPLPSKPEANNGKGDDSAVVFRLVPPGEYRVLAFSGSDGILAEYPNGYFSTTLTVPEGDTTLTVKIPAPLKPGESGSEIRPLESGTRYRNPMMPMI